MLGAMLAKLIELPVVSDIRGNLCAIEGGEHVPFDIARVFYLYDIPSGSSRGGHAHLRLHQVIVPLSGSFEVMLHDGREQQVVMLNRANLGLHIPPMTWGEQRNFSSGSVCCVLASHHFDESDYIRDFDTFLERVRP